MLELRVLNGDSCVRTIGRVTDLIIISAIYLNMKTGKFKRCYLGTHNYARLVPTSYSLVGDSTGEGLFYMV